MQRLDYNQPDFKQRLKNLFLRPSYPPEIEKRVGGILSDVKTSGDTALVKYAEEIDGVRLTPQTFRVGNDEIKAASRQLPARSRNAIRAALANVTEFSRRRIPQSWSYSPRPGVIVGERFEPMERIGVYVPGGTAPLVSTVIHTAGIAKAAGVKEIVAATPAAKDGTIAPAMLYTMRLAGVTEIYRLGGVYAIGAMAYGTDSIRKVEKIVGPGNAYVTAAKKLVYGETALDMVAGPSEIMIIADSSCDADFIAADMLSQAEHGSGLEQAVLLSTCPDLVPQVEAAILARRKSLSRRSAVDQVIDCGMFLINVESLEQAAAIASDYAPEHLEIMCRQAGDVARKVKAAGAIFIGQWTPEAVGDFCAGPSHVLPTAGSGRFFSGLTVEGFFRRTSIVNYRKHALSKELDTVLEFAAMEGLDAHGQSAAARFKHRRQP